MSIKLMQWVWDNAPVDGSMLLMLLAIANHANDDGVCWPAVGTLANYARIRERQAQNLIKQLEDKGMLTVKRGVGRKQTSIYVLNCGPNQAREKVQSSAQKGAIQRAEDAKKVQSSARKGAMAIAPDPSLEPLTATATATTPALANARASRALPGLDFSLKVNGHTNPLPVGGGNEDEGPPDDEQPVLVPARKPIQPRFDPDLVREPPPASTKKAAASPKKAATKPDKPSADVGDDCKPSSAVQSVLRAYADVVGYGIEWGREGVAAKRAVARGFTAEQVVETYRYMKASPFWQDKHLDLASVIKNLPAYLQSRSTVGKPQIVDRESGLTVGGSQHLRQSMREERYTQQTRDLPPPQIQSRELLARAFYGD